MSAEDLDDLAASLRWRLGAAYTRAASKLDVSQSALSQTIRGLEARLGSQSSRRWLRRRLTIDDMQPWVSVKNRLCRGIKSIWHYPQLKHVRVQTRGGGAGSLVFVLAPLSLFWRETGKTSSLFYLHLTHKQISSMTGNTKDLCKRSRSGRAVFPVDQRLTAINREEQSERPRFRERLQRR